jgi:uncharacterized SAM-binding protein YcdF (DUF218 family)
VVETVVPLRRRRLRRAAARLIRTLAFLLAVAMLLQIVLVTTPATEQLYGWLSVTQDPQPADVIVCLGGRHERLVWTARAYSQKLAPRVIVSNAPGAAEFMRDLLVQCGVPRRDVIVDNRSHTTYEHPAGVAQVPGIDPARDRLLIVTDHEHSRRSAAVFRKAGYAHFSIYGGPKMTLEETSRSMFKWRVQILPRIAYEYAALLQYWLQGKI